MERLDAESAISAGGWDARYAVTLAVTSRNGMAAALIDTNGDEVDVNLDEYQLDDDGHWHQLGSGNLSDWGTSWSPAIAATWGRTEPGATVEIEYLGQRHSIVASDSSWWLFIGPATQDNHAPPRAIDRSS